MAEATRFGHRVFTAVRAAHRRGVRNFVLHGKCILDDWFYYGGAGTHPLIENLELELITKHYQLEGLIILDGHPTRTRTLRLRILERSGAAWHPVASPEPGLPELVDFLGHLPINTTLFGQTPAELRATVQAGAPAQAQKAEPASPQISVAPEGPAAYSSALRCLIDRGALREERIAVVLADFRWFGELQSAPSDRSSEFLERLHQLRRASERYLTFVLTDTLKPFKSALPELARDPGTTKIGRPGVDEIHRAIRRRAPFHHWEALRYLAASLQHAQLSLREAVHLASDLRARLGEQIQDRRRVHQLLREAVSTTIDYVDWQDVVLPEATRGSIERVLNEFQEAVLSGRRLRTKGMLLAGPPGTGKTMLARAIAHRLGFSFRALRLADLKMRYVGHTGARIKQVFVSARSLAPVVLFVDEIETILGSRKGRETDTFAQDAVAEFLSRLDGVDTEGQGILFIGATNVLERVDEALLSRLQLVQIGLPDPAARRTMFAKRLLPSGPGQPDEALPTPTARLVEELARRSAGMSGRAIDRAAGALEEALEETGLKLDRLSEAEFRALLQIPFADAEAVERCRLQACGWRCIEAQPQGVATVQGFGKVLPRLEQFCELAKRRADFTGFGLARLSALRLVGHPLDLPLGFGHWLADRLGLLLLLAPAQLAVGAKEPQSLEALARHRGILIWVRPESREWVRELWPRLRVAPATYLVELSFVSQETANADTGTVLCAHPLHDAVIRVGPPSPDDFTHWLEHGLRRFTVDFDRGLPRRVVARLQQRSPSCIRLCTAEKLAEFAIRAAVAEGSYQKQRIVLRENHFESFERL